ncbi:MAG: SUMF1/EgtB/PvdO family nonheme iron enzyme [Rhizobiales bacterium]|nr:SUMF1/EgtB/PvdO family nonheme iron enzyme [Hyphomicrobiales bacterium]
MTGPWRRENRHAPGRVSRVADLSQAADWELYRKARHQLALPPSDAHVPIGAIFADLPGLSPQLVVIPAGEFWMGSPDEEAGHLDSEAPYKSRVIAEPFAIGRFAVTFDEWDAARAAGAELPNASDRGWGRGNRPVINVSHEDAQAYCRWLSERTGRKYRLPSEAEWEYACRAGTDTPFWWGASISTKQANYDGNYTYGGGAKGEYRQRTVPVDKFEPNPWGLHQVHGNVWEWCADPWHETYQGAPEDGSPWLGGEKSLFVVRGGSWSGNPWNLRSASRSRVHPDLRDDFLGFRVARTLTP